MKKILAYTLLILSFYCSSCETLSSTEGYLANLIGLTRQTTKTQQDIESTQSKIDEIEAQKDQIAADAVYEAETVLNKDPNIKNNIYETSAIRVLDTDAVPNLPSPSPEGKESADTRITLELNPNVYKDDALLKELNASYQKDISNNQKIINQEKNDVIKLQQLNNQEIKEKNDAINLLTQKVNDEDSKVKAEEENKINTIFAGIGGFTVLAGILLIAFTPLKTEGFMLVGLGIVVAPLGLIYLSPWFKWISGIGFGTLFIVVIFAIIKSLTIKKNGSDNQDISDLFVDSIIQLQTNNPVCYAEYRKILDVQLSVDANLKTTIDKRIDDALQAQKPSVVATTGISTK